MDKLHISITAEELFKIGPLSVTNSLLTSWLVIAFLCLLAINVSRSLKKIPSFSQLLIEIPIEALYNLTKSIAGPKAKAFFPYIATFFLYILFSNWSGLIPGVGPITLSKDEKTQEQIGQAHASSSSPNETETETTTDDHEPTHQAPVPIFRAPSADLNMTIALALFSVGLIQYFGLKNLGTNYLKKFFSFKNPIYTFVGLLELISEFAKMISFAFRLFGNIFAGEVLLAVIAALIPILMPIPFYGLEIFVGFIQALVFTMLTLVFLNMATIHSSH